MLYREKSCGKRRGGLKLMVDVIIGDIHVGNKYSRWRMLVEKLEQLEKRFDVETYVLAGDTFQVRKCENSQRLEEEKNKFLKAYNGKNKRLNKTIIVEGNHDPKDKIEEIMMTPPLTIEEVEDAVTEAIITTYAKLWCGNCYVYVLHGHNIGMEKNVNKVGRRAEALRLTKQDLIEKGTTWLRKGTIAEEDWLCLGHFEIPVCDLIGKVIGLSSWTAKTKENIIKSGTKGRIAIINDQNPNETVKLYPLF